MKGVSLENTNFNHFKKWDGIIVLQRKFLFRLACIWYNSIVSYCAYTGIFCMFTLNTDPVVDL